MQAKTGFSAEEIDKGFESYLIDYIHGAKALPLGNEMMPFRINDSMPFRINDSCSPSPRV